MFSKSPFIFFLGHRGTLFGRKKKKSPSSSFLGTRGSVSILRLETFLARSTSEFPRVSGEASFAQVFQIRSTSPSQSPLCFTEMARCGLVGLLE